MENLNKEFDTDYINNLRRRESVEEKNSNNADYDNNELYKKIDARIAEIEAEEEKEKAKKHNKKLKLIKVAIGGAIGFSLVGAAGFGIHKIGNKVTEKNLAEATSIVEIYNQNHLLDNPNSDLMISFKNDIKHNNDFIDIVNCSNELHKLDLEQYPDITCFDEEIEFKDDTKKVEQLIEEYKEAKINLKHSDLVGDDVITFNHQVYVLKELEKIYDEKVFEGCGYLEDYGEISTKLYLADIYGGKPEQYTVDTSNYQSQEYPELTGPGIHYGQGFDSDLLEYAKIINDIKRSKELGSTNNFIYGTIDEYTVYGANVINDIQKQKQKELKESQERTEKYFESFGKSK